MFRRKRTPEDFSAEIEAHVRLETDRLRETGLSEEEARTAAVRAFGNVMRAEERFYEAGRQLWWDHLRSDVRYAFRLMRKNATLTAVILITLALGIGANSIIFSFVCSVVLRPLAYKEPHRLVQLWETGLRSGGEADWVSFPNFRDWRSQNRVFEEMAAYHFSLLTLNDGRGADSVLGLEVTDRLFDVLGVRPAIGRTFIAGEDTPGRETVAVISHALWQRRFSADPGIAGRHVNIDGRPYLIIGVMPASFRFPEGVPGETIVVSIDIWIPMRAVPDLQQRGSHNYWAIARLKTGVDVGQARTQMDTIGARLAQKYPGTNKNMNVAVARLQDHLTGKIRPAMLLLLGAVGMVLLLACTNIAGLLLSRAETRRREMAIRGALGAARGRLIAQTLTESLLLSLLGASAGLIIAHFGTGLLLKFGPASIPRFQDTVIDTPVLLFTAIVAVGAGILFGLAPAFIAARSDLHTSLKEGGTRSTAGSSSLSLRNVLVGGEMALAVVLLIGAGLLIRSFVNVVRLDLGFHAAHLLAGYIGLPQSRYGDAPKQVAYFEEALRRVRALPGVRSAAVSNSVPLTGINDQGDFGIEGQSEPAAGEDGPQANRPKVSAGYFETMGIQLVTGRLFDRHDLADSPYVAIVSDLGAATFWPHQNPIGKRVSVDSVRGRGVWREIVGVVRATRHFGLEAPRKPEIYLPHTQLPSPFMTLVVRAEGDPSGLIPAVRREIASLDPEQAGFGFQSMDDLLSNAKSQRRFQMILIVVFGALAVILAAIGIYGVLDYTVAQRRREIGVRLALGAQPRDVVSMFVKKGLLLTVAGMLVGFAGAVALAQVLATLLFGVTPLDAPTFGAVAVLLATIGISATYLPARGA
ncbi:MAG TPA: ABC transporter permease, partial [Acidobacteriota bacterium]